MPYYTGTVGTPDLLKTTIETLAVTNGYTLDGTWLYKGADSAIQLTAPDGEFLNIIGANSNDGLTDPTTFTRSLYVRSVYWPVTYYLFFHTSPDMCICVINYNTVYTQILMFGDIVKIHSSAYVGGNFFFATHNPLVSTPVDATYNEDVFSTFGESFSYFTVNRLPCGNTQGQAAYTSSIIPFAYCPQTNNENGIHVEIDSGIWDTTNKTSYTDSTLCALRRSPNLGDSQAHLIPMQLQYAMADSLYGYLGYMEHIRFVRNDNYEIGDIITIAPDEWKVFPWYKKDAAQRDGLFTPDTPTGHSGTIGIAIRYDGP